MSKSNEKFMKVITDRSGYEPYFMIEYRDSDGSVHWGYGSYNLSVVLSYKEKYFGGDSNENM